MLKNEQIQGITRSSWLHAVKGPTSAAILASEPASVSFERLKTTEKSRLSTQVQDLTGAEVTVRMSPYDLTQGQAPPVCKDTDSQVFSAIYSPSNHFTFLDFEI